MKNINNTFAWKNNWWYSVIIALLTVWFMLVLSTSIYRLALNETYDTYWLTKYLQAFAWAEWWMELWLLSLKNNSYWYENNITHSINNKSILLSEEPLDPVLFKKNKDVFISYDLKSKSNIISRSIESWKYFIVPLFYTDSFWVINKVTNNIDLSVLSWDSSKIWWNIVWKDFGISWKNNFDELTLWNKKHISWWYFDYSWYDTIKNFLNNSDENYLVLFNSSSVSSISFKLTTTWVNNFFTRDVATIISSWEIWKFKQNLRIDIDNWRYLNLLKYSIFSN